MAGIGVVFRRSLVDGKVTLWASNAAAEAAMNNYADQLKTAYQTRVDPGATDYGERREHPDGGRFAVMCCAAPDFPGAPGYPAPPSLLGNGATIEWVGENWDPPPP